jgi:hypothetical protein
MRIDKFTLQGMFQVPRCERYAWMLLIVHPLVLIPLAVFLVQVSRGGIR